MLSRLNLFFKRKWVKFRLKGCIKSEQRFYKKELEQDVLEQPRTLDNDYSTDAFMFFGTDQKGNSLVIQLSRHRFREAVVWLILRLEDGRTFTLPDHPDTQLYNVRGDAFCAGGLYIEAMIPFISMRITFNGLLRPLIRRRWSSDYAEDELLLVKFSFIFTAKTKPTYWPYNWNLDLMATSVACQKWRGFEYLPLLSEPDSRGYEQFGAMKGEILIDQGLVGVQRIELNLPGLKMRRWCPLPVTLFKQMVYLIGFCSDGMGFFIGTFMAKQDYKLQNAKFGGIITPNGFYEPINWIALDLDDLVQANPARNTFIVQFRVAKKIFKLEIRTHPASQVPLFSGRPLDWATDQHSISFTIAGGPSGRGFAIYSHPEMNPGYGPSTPELVYKTLSYYSIPPEPDKFILLFFEEAARSVDISGGKGASLSILSILSLSTDIGDNVDPKLDDELRQRQAIQPPEFTVPQGFIISSSALKKTIQTSVVLQTSIDRLLKLSAEGKDIQWLCMDISNQLLMIAMDTEVGHAIKNGFRSLFDISGRRKDFSVSVRSSSISEDTVEVSGAGQNETVLGVMTEKDVLLAVKKCWASLFSFRSVEYRRQTMQPIDTGMAVIVQIMLAPECAGVLFSQNPSTDDNRLCVITANFGLGGTVVSAEAEPDQYIVQKSYNASRLTIINRRRGSKKVIAVVGKKGQVQNQAIKPKNFCLNDEMVLKLARIAVIFERLFAYPVDIEWAISMGKINILQCRAITTSNRFTDWELKHEFDSAVMTDEDMYTTANVHEALPNALTLATMSFFISSVDQALKLNVEGLKVYPQELHRFMPCFNYHVFLDVYNFLLRYNDKDISIESVVMGMALMGKDYLLPEIHKIALKRHPPNKKEKFKMIYKMLSQKDPARVARNTSNAFRNYYSKEDLMDFETALSLLDDIEEHKGRLLVTCRCHYDQSITSTVYQTLATSIVCRGRTISSPEVQEDVSQILKGVNGTVSGEIPKKLEAIMRKIILSGMKDTFCGLQRFMGMQWLKVNIPEAGIAFEEFIQKNRHRGIHEMELFTTTWGMDPGIVIEMLQRNLRTMNSVENLNSHILVERPSPKEIVAKLKTSRMWVTKLTLRKVIGRLQNAVQGRESTKNSLTSVLHEFRLAIRHLGVLMSREGLISSPDLVFYMTPKEWRHVIVTRDLKCVRKALQRKRIFPQLNLDRFPEFSFGVPKPAIKSPVLAIAGKGIRGTPIHGGLVSGRAAVLENYSEVDKLQSGDILITRSTDIGWSPYFPILRGLVTEMGGVLSHGTIVAREYGLPCIIAAENATHFFRHGEQVTLDATNGMVFRS